MDRNALNSNGQRFWMLSQMNDWLPPWRPGTAYLLGQGLVDPNSNIQIAQSSGTSGAEQPVWSTTRNQSTADSPGAPPWQATTAYVTGQYILDSNGNLQRALSSGASGSTSPKWQQLPSQSVSDGNVTWVCCGPPLSWTNSGPGAGISSSMSSWQPNTPYAVGQYIVDSNGNLQCVINAGNGGGSGAAPPGWAQALSQSVPDGSLTWVCAGPSQAGLFYCNTSQRLQLRSMRTGSAPVEDFGIATAIVETVPMTLDEFGNYARWDTLSKLVVAGGSGPSNAPPPDEVPIYWPAQPNVSDLAMGYDGILYIAAGGALVRVDQRGRWPNYTLTVANFSFWRLAALPEGGVLALDRNAPQLGKVSGQPLQTGPADTPNPGVMRPCQANPNPPQIVARYSLPAGEQYVALAPMDPAQQPAPFVLLSWANNSASNTTAYLRLFNETTLASTRLQLGGVALPYAITWLGDQKLAVLATNLNEALIYNLSNVNLSASNTAEVLVPAGETYVLSANNVGPIVHGFQLPPNYTNPAWVADPAGSTAPVMLPLVPLSLNTVAATGATSAAAPSIIDSGTVQNTWHRMFVEAVVPAQTGAILWLTASDNLIDLTNLSYPWYPHTLGDANLASIPTAMLADAPSAVWQSIPTEVPFAPALLGSDPGDAPITGTQGLFMVLVQRANKAVRTLSGRYLGVRIQLNGNGRITPEIAGMRVYGPRFSYVQNYLPEIYHEDKFGPAADVDGPSTRRDFFERFVDLFEAQFTRIEDRIANAYLLMRTESTPEDALPWLGAWIGITPDSYPPDRSRARLKATPSLYRWRGTTKGITEALDVATGGMCKRGAIIVIEDYRLRHIFATILGADLSIQNDPLLPGYWGSSNSIVGDTLFLGDPRTQAEVQALYENDLDLAGGAQAAKAFYDKLAMRMTVFIHNQVENVNLKLVRRIVEEEKPAHVQAFVRVATAPFMIGLASLLGVNTYLGPQAPLNTAAIDVSDVGRYDVVTHMPSLDPRMENGQTYEEYASPIARIKVPAGVKPGDTIMLDGSASTAPSGLTITSYQWTLVQPQS